MVQGITSLNASQPPQGQLPPDAQASLGKGFSSLTPEEISHLRELSDDLKELSPDKIKVLEQIITFLKKNSDNYDKAVQVLVSKNVLEPGDLPPTYIPAFFEILDNMVKAAMTGEPQKFARGGVAQLRQQAQNLQNAGTGGDKVLAHINPREAAMLQATQGGGTNPTTGLPEFGFFDDIGGFLKQAAGVVLPVALTFMGVPPVFAGAIGSGIGAMINGASPGQALGAAAMGGLGGALFSGVQGAMSPGGSFMGGVEAGFKPTNSGIFSDAFGGYNTPAATPAVTPTAAATPAMSPQSAAANAAAQKPGLMQQAGNWISTNPLPAVGIAALGGAALGSSMNPPTTQTSSVSNLPKGPTEEQINAARYPAGSFVQYTAPKVNVTPYFSTYAAAQGGHIDSRLDARVGGHLHGPGTGTSDSIPAKLSDGEFVMTAKAVRGAGGGDREAGARKMYQLMHHFEKGA
jgi:hypothetical protein